MAKDKGEVKFGEQLTARGHLLRSTMTSGPGIFWVTFFLLLPLLWIGVVSFLTRGEVGGYERPFTFENYSRFVGFGFFGYDLLYPQIILRSLVLGAGTAIFCMLAALPLAFFIAGLPARYKNLALTLVLIPFWTNLLIRTYAWQILLAPESPLTHSGCHVALGRSPASRSIRAPSPFISAWSAIICRFSCCRCTRRWRRLTGASPRRPAISARTGRGCSGTRSCRR